MKNIFVFSALSKFLAKSIYLIALESTSRAFCSLKSIAINQILAVEAILHYLELIKLLLKHKALHWLF